MTIIMWLEQHHNSITIATASADRTVPRVLWPYPELDVSHSRPPGEPEGRAVQASPRSDSMWSADNDIPDVLMMAEGENMDREL